MKVQELLTKMYSVNFNWLEELEVKHYVSIMDKKKFCIDVISACTDEIDGFISADKFKMNIYFNMKLLSLYTNLEIATDFNAMIEQYDILCENGTLGNLISLFTNEYEAMNNVLDMLIDELLVQNSIDMQVVKIGNRIMNIIDMAEKSLDVVDVSSILPEGLEELMKSFNSLK